MTIDELRGLIERHGADRGRWPAALDAEAARLIASHPAAALIERELQFERLLAAIDGPAAPPTHAIVAAVTSRQRRRRWYERDWLSGDFGWVHGAAFAGCLLIGFFVGTVDRAHPVTVADEFGIIDGGSVDAIDE